MKDELKSIAIPEKLAYLSGALTTKPDPISVDESLDEEEHQDTFSRLFESM